MTSDLRVHGSGEGVVVFSSLDFRFVITAHGTMGHACEQKECLSEALVQISTTESPLQPTSGVFM